jgi:glyoxalase family protein
MKILGLHHITAMAGDVAANVSFYTHVLGLRLIKRTVNFDDPSTYHLYFGDTVGTPGSALTFFYWAGQPRGRAGPGQATAIAWSVPAASASFWRERLAARQVAFTEEIRFGETVLRFADPDGLGLEIVATSERDARLPWAHPEIPVAHGLRGFHSVTLTHADSARSARLLVDRMGFRETARASASGQTRARHAIAAGGPGTYVDLVAAPSAPRGQPGVGTVHHVAFRVADDADELVAQAEWRNAGLSVSPQMDRNYFHSIYAREPGGVLFEIATDAPGFLIDETVETLGTTLKLPAHYEQHRAAIHAHLEPLPV